MSRRKEAPADMDCPFRHQCPHLEGMAACWLLESHQEAFELREQLDAMEQRYEARLAELTRTLLERSSEDRPASTATPEAVQNQPQARPGAGGARASQAGSARGAPALAAKRTRGRGRGD